MTVLKPKIITFPYLLAGSAPFVRINFDAIGPFDTDVYGNTHALVILDTFSRYVKIRPLRDLSGITAAHHLKEFVNTFGVPAVMLSDNGTQFVNEALTAYARMAGSEKLETLAYSHEENGLVERANREVLRHVRTLIYETTLKKHWSEMLPDVERMINSTHHSAIGTTPARIVFGTSVDLHRGFITPLDESFLPVRQDYREFALRQSVFQTEVIKHAQKMQQEREKRIQVGTDADNKYITTYPLGSFVMLKVDNAKRNRAEDKLSPRWTGPYRVIAMSHQGHRYEIEEIHSGTVRKVHVTELKKFLYDPATDPTIDAIARADHYIVESIVGHRKRLIPSSTPKGQNKSVYEFHVHWEGYPPSDRTWEPIQNLRVNSIFHDYCEKHRLTSLIPKKFRK